MKGHLAERARVVTVPGREGGGGPGLLVKVIGAQETMSGHHLSALPWCELQTEWRRRPTSQTASRSREYPHRTAPLRAPTAKGPPSSHNCRSPPTFRSTLAPSPPCLRRCCTQCSKILDDNVFSTDPTFSKTAAAPPGRQLRPGERRHRQRRPGPRAVISASR